MALPVLPYVTKRLLEPLLIRVDFTDPCWSLSLVEARAWLAGAVAADLSVQALVGSPNLLSVLASFLTMAIFWTIPARLSGAVGGLYIAQALGSVAVVTTAATLSDVEQVPDVAGLLWWAWCMFALVKLILAYIRTPKAMLG